MQITRPLLIGVLCVASYAAAQVPMCLPESHKLPDDLRSSLEARLTIFLTAQAQGHWDDVEELFGSRYKSSYRRCLVSRMQELRMVSFDLSDPDLYTCTVKMELPAGTVDRVTAEQLSWYVRGTARFQTSSETWVEETQIRAYRDHGQWYFIPPQQAMQMQYRWEKIHYTEADFARDRRDEIDIRNSPSSPIEITDLHAYMIRKFPSLRNIKFTLRNKTSKEVVFISVRIGIEGLEGSTEMEGPYQIKPKGSLTLEQDDSAYGDFCNGVWRREIVITQVEFADGTKWEFKEPAVNEKRSECGADDCQ